MSKNLPGQKGSSTTPFNNNNSSSENLHNSAGKNFSATDTNNSGVKSPQEISKEFEAKAGNLGYGIGNFFSNNPIVKAVAGLFSSGDKMPSSPTSFETNRKLLQASTLSPECQGIINQLDLDDANKAFLIEATGNLIDRLTLSKIELINKYLLDSGGNLYDAAQVISGSFQRISQKEAEDFLKSIHDNSNHPGSLRTYLENCIKRNTNITHSPTHTPTKQPTEQPTNRPTKVPTTSIPTKNPTTHSPTQNPTTHSPTPPTQAPTPEPKNYTGEIAGSTVAAVICVLAMAAMAVKKLRNSRASVAPAIPPAGAAPAAGDRDLELALELSRLEQRAPIAPVAENKDHGEHKDADVGLHVQEQEPERVKSEEEIEADIKVATDARFNADYSRIIAVSRTQKKPTPPPSPSSRTDHEDTEVVGPDGENKHDDEEENKHDKDDTVGPTKEDEPSSHPASTSTSPKSKDKSKE